MQTMLPGCCRMEGLCSRAGLGGGSGPAPPPPAQRLCPWLCPGVGQRRLQGGLGAAVGLAGAPARPWGPQLQAGLHAPTPPAEAGGQTPSWPQGAAWPPQQPMS